MLTSLALLLTALALVSQLSVLEIENEDKLERFIVRCGSRLIIGFNNSVTERPVEITYKICGAIMGETIRVDEATKEYYSQGLIDVSAALRGYKASKAEFCSIVGFSVRVETITGTYAKLFRGECFRIEVKTAWQYIEVLQERSGERWRTACR